jgi:hypothetical protein
MAAFERSWTVQCQAQCGQAIFNTSLQQSERQRGIEGQTPCNRYPWSSARHLPKWGSVWQRLGDNWGAQRGCHTLPCSSRGCDGIV